MLKGLFMTAMLCASYGIVYLIYGRDGIALRDRQGKKIWGPCIGIALLLMPWIMGVGLVWSVNTATRDIWLAIGVTILMPIIVLILTLITRKRVREALEQEKSSSYESVTQEQFDKHI